MEISLTSLLPQLRVSRGGGRFLPAAALQRVERRGAPFPEEAAAALGMGVAGRRRPARPAGEALGAEAAPAPTADRKSVV